MFLSILLVEIVSAAAQEWVAAESKMERAQEHELYATIHPHVEFCPLASRTLGPRRNGSARC